VSTHVPDKFSEINLHVVGFCIKVMKISFMLSFLMLLFDKSIEISVEYHFVLIECTNPSLSASDKEDFGKIKDSTGLELAVPNKLLSLSGLL
jgi:hypothetical protein